MAMDDTKKPCKSNPSKKKLASAVNEALTEPVSFEFPIDWGNPKDDTHHDAGDVCRRLIAVGRIISAVIQTFAKGVGVPSATKSAITIPVQVPIKGQQLVPYPTLYENFARTAQELRANVSDGQLRPHVEALSDQTLVPILRALSDNHVKREAPPTLVDAAGRHALPVLEDQDFDEPAEEEASIQTGTFPINGIRISSTRELFILSSAGLAIRMDQASALRMLRWHCQDIYDGAWAEGTIKRGDDRVWEFEGGAKLVTSDSTTAPATNGNEKPD